MFSNDSDGNQRPKAILQYPAGLWVKVQYIGLPNFIIFTFEMWNLQIQFGFRQIHKCKQLKNKIFLQKVNDNDLNVETT